MIAIANPVAIPASAPFFVVRFQNNASRTTGPKALPKPAHAKDTTDIMEVCGSRARTAAITAITITPILPIHISFFSVGFFFATFS